MKYQKEVFRNFTLIIQFGINMLVPILLCTFVGIYLDRLFSTSFIVIILFFLGAAAGFRNIYVFAKKSGSKTSYIGSDTDKMISNISGENGSMKDKDIFEKIDIMHRENLNEQTKNNP